MHDPCWSQAALVADALRAERQGSAGLRRRQRARLAALVATARRRSPLYRRRYRGLPEEPWLAALPPVSKQDLMADVEGWVTDPAVTRAGLDAFVEDPTRVGMPFLGRYLVCTSSGTSGHPGLFVHDAHSVAVYRAMSTARIDRYWLPPATWAAMWEHRLRWLSVVGTGGHYAGEAWIESERRRGGWRARAYRAVSVQQPMDAVVTAVEAADPAVLTGYPSALDLLATARRDGALASVRPVFVESSGETLTPRARQRIAEAFSCPTREAYAASEFLLLGFSCRTGWLHVNADWAVLEPVDAEGRPTAPGEVSHTVLLTNLANRVQPLIRYDLGDAILVRPDACPCGIRLPAVRVSGRAADALRLTGNDGRVVAIPPLALGSVADQTPGVVRCQVVQGGPAVLILRLDVDPRMPTETVWATLLQRVGRFLEDCGLRGVDLRRSDEAPAQGAGGKYEQIVISR